MIYLLHILLGSFISRYSHSNPCSCHHTGARCTFSAKKSNTAPIVPMGPFTLQFFQVCISPFLLFGESGHAHPEQIRLCLVYGGYHGLIVFLGEFRLVGWGNKSLSGYWDITGRLFTFIFPQGCLRYFPERSSFPFRFSFIHFVQKQVPSRCALYLLMSQEFECQYNACSVWNQCVSPPAKLLQRQGSFNAVLYECALMVLINSLPSGNASKLTSVFQKRNRL